MTDTHEDFDLATLHGVAGRLFGVEFAGYVAAYTDEYIYSFNVPVSVRALRLLACDIADGHDYQIECAVCDHITAVVNDDPGLDPSYDPNEGLSR